MTLQIPKSQGRIITTNILSPSILQHLSVCFSYEMMEFVMYNFTKIQV